MTDNEIIKYMQCVIGNEVNCSECTYQKVLPFPSCRMMCAKNALDLINRQKAENEKLKAENEVMKTNCNSMYVSMPNMAKAERAEAIKDFAEELEYFVLHEDIEVVEPKCKDYESYINGANQFRHQIKNGINNLVKEMTEIATNQRKEDEGK